MANIGDQVGGHRWPMDSAHPDCWTTPLRGVVLSPTDPQAWVGTMAFPPTMYPGGPTDEQAKNHVCRTNLMMEDHGYPLVGDATVPVLWEFGTVMWERQDAIRPYAEDLADWEAARAAAYAALDDAGVAWLAANPAPPAA